MSNLAFGEIEIPEGDKKLIKWTRKEARKAILELFKKEGELGYSEIIERLGINLDVVIGICEELKQDKKIEAL